MSVNRVEVTINSRQYAVLAEESEEYIRRLAGHIDQKVKMVLKGGQNVMGERPIILAALNICDEYYKCEEAARVMERQLMLTNEKLTAANLKIASLSDSGSQISINEQHLEDRLLNAHQKIEELEQKIKELEGKRDNSTGY